MKIFKKSTIVITVLLIITLNVKAQDRSGFYTNILNPFLANPAMAGSTDNIHAIFNTNSYLGGIESMPRTYNFGIHSPLNNTSGGGLKVISNWRGAFQTINVEGAYSKQVKFTSNNIVTFGLSLGFVQTNLKNEMLTGQVDLNDPTLANPDLNRMLLTSGAGAVYRYKKSFEIYATSPMLVTGDQRLTGFFVAGANYSFKLDRAGEYSLKPIVNYYNFENSPKLVDGILAGTWNETITLQAGYRTNGAVISSIGFNFKNLTIGYAYLHSTGNLENLVTAQNEIAIALNFKKFEKRLRKKQEIVSEQVIQDQIDKINDKVNGLINIEKSNPGLVNVNNEMVKLNKELEKILVKYKIENIEQLKKIKELQVNIELLIAKYNDK